MKLLSFGILFIFFFISSPIIAQTSIEDLVKEGIQYHDNGEYDKAIEIYKKALKIDPKSPLLIMSSLFMLPKETISRRSNIQIR